MSSDTNSTKHKRDILMKDIVDTEYLKLASQRQDRRIKQRRSVSDYTISDHATETSNHELINRHSVQKTVGSKSNSHASSEKEITENSEANSTSA